jgi:DNA-directed RNA polymerase omega subunit
LLEYKGIDSKFRVVILVSKRAKQLINGSRKRVEMKAENPLTIAMEEFHQGKINFNILMEEQDKFDQALQAIENSIGTPPPAIEALNFAADEHDEPEEDEEEEGEASEDEDEEEADDEEDLDEEEDEPVEAEEEKVD